MTAYAHGVLRNDRARNEFHRVAFSGRDSELLTEYLEGEAGPQPVDYAHAIALLGERGWEMFQVTPHDSGDADFWFRRRLD